MQCFENGNEMVSFESHNFFLCVIFLNVHYIGFISTFNHTVLEEVS